MRSFLTPMQKRSAEDMILYYHTARGYREKGEPELEAPFKERYETERRRLSEALGRAVAVKGDNAPCYKVVDLISGKAIFKEGDK